MKIIEDWQYRYIEKCLYNYENLLNSHLETEIKMVEAIDKALEYFEGTNYHIMMTEFYIRCEDYRKRLTNAGHYKYVCNQLLFTEECNGYVMRRDIVYKIAMNCYALGVFRIKKEEIVPCILV